MHVLIIPSEHFVTPRYPVGGIFQQHQAASLHGTGHTVGVIGAGVISPRFTLQGYPYKRRERTSGYPVLREYVHSVLPARWVPFDATFGRLLRVARRLFAAYLREFGTPDVLHAHNLTYAGLIAQSLHLETGIPYVVTEHSSEFLLGRPSPQISHRLAACARGAGAMTAVSQALARAITSWTGVTEIGIIPNLIDSVMLDSPLVNAVRRTEGPVFLNVASLDDNKNQAGLIDAFALGFSGATATLRLGGTGPREAALRAHAIERGVGGQVVFLGHLPREAMIKELQGCDCFVLASRHETFGVVLIEALACGRPIISTRCGGPEDIVTNDCGLLVEKDDPAALASAMRSIATTLETYSPSALRDSARLRFGESAFVANAMRTYRAALRTR